MYYKTGYDTQGRNGMIMENRNTHYYDSNGCGTAIDSGLVYYDCSYRLPCGYCKILMRDCIKPTQRYTTTYASSKDNNK